MTRDEWIELDTKNAERFNQQMAEFIRTGSEAEKDYYRAVWAARDDINNNYLMPSRTESGLLVHTDFQGNRAACLAREDSAITAQLQLKILERLDRNRKYLLVAILLLLFLIAR